MRKTITLSIFVLVMLCMSFITASAASSTVNFEVSQFTVDEDDSSTPGNFWIRRSGDLSEPATVSISSVNGSAMFGQDFELVGPSTVTFAPGVSQVRAVVRARDDYLYERTEWFSIQLHNPSPNLRLGSQRVITVFINDADDYPAVIFATPTNTFMRIEPMAGRQAVGSVGIYLTKQSVDPVTVTVTTTDGTATGGADYISSATTITFAPLEYRKEMTVTILGDNVSESRETFDLNFVDPKNADAQTEPRPFTIISRIPYLQQVDFDGNGVADFAGYAPTTGRWFIANQYGESSFQLGVPGDVPTPGDYTGDGQTDAAVWRPSTGTLYVVRSEDSSYYAFPFGIPGDIPVPADFDADGIADFAVFRPSTGVWYINRSSNGLVDVVHFGMQGDRPVPTDFDGDWKADLAIYRPSSESSQWWIKRSSDGLVTVTGFGRDSDRTVAADYTGDGKADIAVWRPSNGQWFVLRSEDLSLYVGPYGFNQGPQPAPGDYSGDGFADFGWLETTSHRWEAYYGLISPWQGLVTAHSDPTVTAPLASVNVH